ncbi:MAG: peptidoglycan-binding protein [Bacteroidetes bacterium HGW-Bacteroidetes-17]|nr:MAG: peptidoglycan-binding protein [Bacteroidetes bacterium HGW-Bacteroidetes-17]
MNKSFINKNLKSQIMKTNEMKVASDNLKNNQRKEKTLRLGLISLFSVLILIFSTNVSFAHCDQMNGPLVSDAKKAIEQNNVNIVLKWVQAAHETEIKDAFNQMMKVRALSPDAKTLSEKYFFETIVRIHRAGEGVPFTGVKPEGTPIDEKVMAADKSIELGNLSPLESLVAKKDLPELTERFNKVMSLKNFDVNNVEAGREYIEAYVLFFKFAEGETESHAAHGNGSDAHVGATSHLAHLPWILSGLFLITTILFGALYFKKENNKKVRS